MNSLERLLRELNIFIDQSLDFLENPVIRLSLVILLILYSTAVIPYLNRDLNKVFNHTVVKFLMLIVVMYLGVKDPTLALLVTIAYMMSIVQTNYYGSYDSIEIKDYKSEELKNEKLNETPSQNNESQNNNGFNNNSNGFNQDDKQCNNICTRNEDLNNNEQCTPITAFSNELNTQGLNCPMGGNGVNLFGSPF